MCLCAGKVVGGHREKTLEQDGEGQEARDSGFNPKVNRKLVQMLAEATPLRPPQEAKERVGKGSIVDIRILS